MGDGEHESPVDQRQHAVVEIGIEPVAVGPVAIQQAGCRMVQSQPTPVQHRHRHLRAVMRHRHQPPGHIVLWGVAGRDVLPLQQPAGVGDHVVVVGLGRRRHRRVDEPHLVRLVFEARLHPQRIGLLRHRDGVLRPRGLADHDARQRILSLAADQPLAERQDRQDHAALAVAHEIAPLRPTGGVQRRRHDLEVLGPVRIREDHEVGPQMLHLVAQARRARLDQSDRSVWHVAVDDPDLGGIGIAGLDEAEAP